MSERIEATERDFDALRKYVWVDGVWIYVGGNGGEK